MPAHPIDKRTSDVKFKQLKRVDNLSNVDSTIINAIEQQTNVLANAPTEWAIIKAYINDMRAALGSGIPI